MTDGAAPRNDGVGAAPRNDGIFLALWFIVGEPFGVASTLLDFKAFAST
jgi:hypothetical protein